MYICRIYKYIFFALNRPFLFFFISGYKNNVNQMLFVIITFIYHSRASVYFYDLNVIV